MTSINQKLFERKKEYEKLLTNVKHTINDTKSTMFDFFNQRDVYLISLALEEAIDNIDKTLKSVS